MGSPTGSESPTESVAEERASSSTAFMPERASSSTVFASEEEPAAKRQCPEAESEEKEETEVVLPRIRLFSDTDTESDGLSSGNDRNNKRPAETQQERRRKRRRERQSDNKRRKLGLFNKKLAADKHPPLPVEVCNALLFGIDMTYNPDGGVCRSTSRLDDAAKKSLYLRCPKKWDFHAEELASLQRDIEEIVTKKDTAKEIGALKPELEQKINKALVNYRCLGEKQKLSDIKILRRLSDQSKDLEGWLEEDRQYYIMRRDGIGKWQAGKIYRDDYLFSGKITSEPAPVGDLVPQQFKDDFSLFLKSFSEDDIKTGTLTVAEKQIDEKQWRPLWQFATTKEVKSCFSNNVFHDIAIKESDLPPGANILPTRYVFTCKLNPSTL